MTIRGVCPELFFFPPGGGQGFTFSALTVLELDSPASASQRRALPLPAAGALYVASRA